MSSKETFLTDKQRETLKIATQNTVHLSSSPTSPSPLLSDNHTKGQGGGKPTITVPPARNMRRSHSGKLLRVKKDGGGGKGTWGKLLDTGDECRVDRNDPNYDSCEEPYKLTEPPPSDPLGKYKKCAVSIIEEYFATGNVEAAGSDLEELGSSEYHPYFIKRLVSMAMDRHDKEKEMASVLLSSLYADVMSPPQISEGFALLLESVDDLTVDIPDAVGVLALFIARAVVDEILPPAFLTRSKRSLRDPSKGRDAVEMAGKSYLSAPHHAEMVGRKWGGTTRTTADEVKRKIVELLKEYVETGDVSEACECVRELGVSFFHHEVVKRALVIAVEFPPAVPLVMKLLREASDEGLVSSNQMSKGFARVYETLDDLALDVPSAGTLYRSIVSAAVSEGWLDPSADCDAPVRKFKEEAAGAIREYFLSDDIPELIRSLEEMASPEYNPLFVKKLVTIAMDRKNHEKEMASVLLSALHVEMFSTEDIVSGFVLLLESAEDTALDIVDAPNELAMFLARAVIDDVLAPLNLEEIRNRLPPGCAGRETARTARSLTAARHAGERILRGWGGGTGWAVEDAKDRIVKLLEEYATGGGHAEACHCIRDLGMPFFNHEVVKRALVMAMERKDDDGMLRLLQECFGEGIITINQMAKGFTRVKDALDDLALDIPNATEKFRVYTDFAIKSGWLVSTAAASWCLVA